MKSTTTCFDCNSATGEQKRHKHIWMYSTFCDTCDCDFNTWLQGIKEEVARNLILEDFNKMLYKMCEEEGKIDRNVLLEMHRKMRELARARGYLRRYPFQSD